ncbi:7241_t:CDS:10 [Funneliformis mosseae]|uniref:7241_t:CDS:1 n=1 Tax=Funneliformis mosseae TaxID=27381 RepID=A0A9N9D0U0_FUNMO|nr:7241_t:CDS:10 [Funneliformis mosseae]
MLFHLFSALITTAVVLLFILLLIYTICLVLFVLSPTFQSYLVFLHWLNYPSSDQLDQPECFGLQAFSTRHIWVRTRDNVKLGGWHILSRQSIKKLISSFHAFEIEKDDQSETLFEQNLKSSELIILYFHGQLGNRGKENRVLTYKSLQIALPTADVVTIDYRGFGDSEGFPTEDCLLIDARAAWDWILERAPAKKIIIYGHSLGTGVAIRLARQLSDEGNTPLAIILESPFTCIPELIASFRRLPFLRPFTKWPAVIDYFKEKMEHRFNNMEHMKHLNDIPILIIHSHKDDDIPLSHSVTLFQEIIDSRQIKHRKIEPTFMKFVREGTLYTQHDVKIWYLQSLHAAHNNAHGWEFVGDKLREFLEEFSDYKVKEIKNVSSNISIKSNLSSDTSSNKSKNL